MRGSRLLSFGVAAGLLALTLLTPAGRGRAEATDETKQKKDPLAAEIDRWSSFLQSNTSTDEMWTQVKQSMEPAVARAREALRDGRRLLALQRLAAARLNLAASVYLAERGEAERKD